MASHFFKPGCCLSFSSSSAISASFLRSIPIREFLKKRKTAPISQGGRRRSLHPSALRARPSEPAAEFVLGHPLILVQPDAHVAILVQQFDVGRVAGDLCEVAIRTAVSFFDPPASTEGNELTTVVAEYSLNAESAG